MRRAPLRMTLPPRRALPKVYTPPTALRSPRTVRGLVEWPYRIARDATTKTRRNAKSTLPSESTGYAAAMRTE